MATVLRRAGFGFWQAVARAQRHFRQKEKDSDADGDLDRAASAIPAGPNRSRTGSRTHIRPIRRIYPSWNWRLKLPILDAPAFVCDPLALALAQEAVAAGADAGMNAQEKAFLYMPCMHSESPIIQAVSVQLFDQPGLEYNLKFAREHKAIIDRFGRYPHRNEVLGRISTEAERAFLREPGSSF